MKVSTSKAAASKILTISLIAVTTTAGAVPFAFEARSLGMGGANVASADIATASWANPAMLMNQRPGDDFSFLLGAGAFLRDDGDLVGDIDAFQSADTRREDAQNSGDAAAQGLALLEMSQILRRVEDKAIAPEITAAVALGTAFDSFAFAFSARADLIAGGVVANLACELGTPGCDSDQFESEIDSDQFNILNVDGVAATELGVSFATAFPLMDRKFSIGIKPKIVDLQGVTYNESIKTADAGFDNINDEDSSYDIGTFSTIDLGLAYDISDSFRFGLSVRNLLTDEFKVGNQTLNFDTEARIGIAYHTQFMTLVADYDIVENEPLLANDVFDGLKTQYLNVGAEFNAFDYAQLRLGASRNMADGVPGYATDTAFTAGIGLWLGFNLDIAATFTDNTVGGFLQTGFRF